MGSVEKVVTLFPRTCLRRKELLFLIISQTRLVDIYTPIRKSPKYEHIPLIWVDPYKIGLTASITYITIQ